MRAEHSAAQRLEQVQFLSRKTNVVAHCGSKVFRQLHWIVCRLPMRQKVVDGHGHKNKEDVGCLSHRGSAILTPGQL